MHTSGLESVFEVDSRSTALVSDLQFIIETIGKAFIFGGKEQRFDSYEVKYLDQTRPPKLQNRDINVISSECVVKIFSRELGTRMSCA